MQLNFFKGYPDYVGKRFIFAGYGKGPSAYVQTGDQIYLPRFDNYMDVVFNATSLSGNYIVRAVASALGPRANWSLLWSYAAGNPSPSNPVGVPVGVPLGLSPVSPATSTTVGVTSNVLTVAIVNTLKVGQFVYLQSFTAGGALNGMIVRVLTASATGFTAHVPTPNITAATADVTGTYQVVQVNSGNLLQLGTAATITNSLATSSLITMTAANSFKPGQFVFIDGLTNGATSNGVIVQVATASATQFTANWTGTAFSTAADAGTASLVTTNGGAPVTIGSAAAITNSVATASSAGTAGVISLSAVQALVPGNIVVVQGLTNGAAVNGDLMAVISTGLTSALFEANRKTAAITTGADAGTASLLVTGAPLNSADVVASTDLSGETVQIGGFGGVY